MAKRPSSSKTEQRSPAKKAKVQSVQPRGILKSSNRAGESSSIRSKNAAVHQADANDTEDIKGKGKAVESKALKLPSASSIPPRPYTAFEVVAGSYERILYGLHCTPSGAGSDTRVDMQPIFQFPAHLSGVKSTAASPNGRWLVTGSADEVIKVWDLRRRKEVGGLVGHEGDITCLVFPNDKYLVSGSADGTMCLFRSKDWSMLRRFKGHKGRINSIAVHPQGRVALTVSKDRCLRLWDLLGKGTAKGSSSTRLGAEADLVKWDINGTRFAVILDREIRIFTTDMELVRTFTSLSRFHDVAFLEKDGVNILLVACDDGKVRLYRNWQDPEVLETVDTEKLGPIAELVGFDNRVKTISILQVLGQQLCAAISSDGTIRTFNLSALEVAGVSDVPQVLQPLGTYDTKGSRLTCMTAVAVKDDRTTTYAESVGSASDSDSDFSDKDSDEAVISVREVDNAQENARAIMEESADEGNAVVEEEEEWGGINE